MRLEEIVSQALKRVNNDRYILSLAVGQRADELTKGAKPLLPNPTSMKFTDIALKEIAQGLISVDGLVDK
jgi:DNA-directed RNA polymerase subunit omega